MEVCNMKKTAFLFLFPLVCGCSYISDFISTKEPSLTKGVLPVLPPGYCYLDAKNSKESKILYKIQEQYGKKNNVKIQVFVPCVKLEAIRKGLPDQKITQYGMMIELEASEAATKKDKKDKGGDSGDSEN